MMRLNAGTISTHCIGWLLFLSLTLENVSIINIVVSPYYCLFLFCYAVLFYLHTYYVFSVSNGVDDLKWRDKFLTAPTKFSTSRAGKATVSADQYQTTARFIFIKRNTNFVQTSQTELIP